MMELIENLKWRYATKKFDASKKVSAENIEHIKEAVQLAASSYGLQPYKVIEISDTNLREALQSVSWGQKQVTDASHFFVFCNYINVSDAHIEEMTRLKAEVTGKDRAAYQAYSTFVKGKLHQKSDAEMTDWTARQTYIALANAMMACAELKVDCTPMEGFESQRYDELLGLPDIGLHAAVALAVGYRHEEDRNQYVQKVRKPFESLYLSM